jgi:hypothetical protein
MPNLWWHYDSKMTTQWAEKVQEAAKERVDLSQTATFDGDGNHMLWRHRAGIKWHPKGSVTNIFICLAETKYKQCE